ncbi:MAG TPA: hypothetical protein VJ779_04420 [Acetobacteraceae bacterium]|jgi:hypothetical protein|nr:hypothetical protein [Acetobacteraceae bacterium]
MYDGPGVREAELVVPVAALLFVAALHPTVIAAMVALALLQGWSWWGWSMTVAGALWSAPLAWGVWAAARHPDTARAAPSRPLTQRAIPTLPPLPTPPSSPRPSGLFSLHGNRRVMSARSASQAPGQVPADPLL